VNGPRIEADYTKKSLPIDGGWGEWPADYYTAGSVVYGSSNWKNSEDLYFDYKVMWDEDYLYIAWKVTDDNYVQKSTGENIYLGDSVEVLLDVYVPYDYWTNWLSGDDYQLGVSPGKGSPGSDPEAYLWFPVGKSGSKSKVLIGVKDYAEGYRISVAIPWSIYGIDPYAGQRFGFAVSVSDDDSAKGKQQQSMVSSSSRRILTDPMTWGDLVLVK
jgi:hypothetical protein